MNAKQILFHTPDQVVLGGMLYQTKTEAKKIIISTHGMATNCFKKRDEKIAKTVGEDGIDYLIYNNRGHDIVSYIQKVDGEKQLGGTAYEDVEEAYYDIVGAMQYALEIGYETIYLLGHSLGATKTVYTYHKLQEEKHEMLKHIKAVILLSLIDIPFATKTYLGEAYPQMLTYAKNMEKENMQHVLMPEKSFIHPISVKTFLQYIRDYQNFDFARYADETFAYPELNAIDVPLFMRWGNEHELIQQKAEDLCKLLKQKIQNENLDIGWIPQANHSYIGKEELLAKEIKQFIM